MSVKNYSPGEVSVIVGGLIIKGKNSVSVEPLAVRWTEDFDVDGGMCLTENKNYKAYKVTLNLHQTAADANAGLTALYLAGGSLPVIVKDNSGYSVYVLANAKIASRPTGAFEQSPTDRTWTFIGEAEIDLEAGN